ncbi:MAG: hypothetical protein ABW168_03080 [Sedimenticola sp.]
MKKYYLPMHERTNTDKMERRSKLRIWHKHYRENNKIKRLKTQPPSEPETIDETAANTPIVVKLPTMQKLKSRKRISRATASNRREIKRLKLENENLNKRFKTVSKRFERVVKRTHEPTNVDTSDENLTKSTTADISVDNVTQVNTADRYVDNVTQVNTAEISVDNVTQVNTADISVDNVTQVNTAEIDIENLTPRKRTATEIREAGLSPRKLPRTIHDKLLFANVITDEIKDSAKKSSHKRKKVISSIVCGRRIRKYKFTTRLSKCIGMRKSSLKENTSPNVTKRQESHKTLRTKVVEFLERDDNSQMMPGKNDYVKSGAAHVQKYTLNDSMLFLHLKFTAENPTIKISYATFCRMRRKHIRLTRYLSRKKCCCQKHQNMALLLKALKSHGVNVPTNPNEYGRQLQQGKTPDYYVSQLSTEIKHVKYGQWKRVDKPDGRKMTTVVTEEVEKEEFCKQFSEQTCEFLVHNNRVTEQYNAMKDLKQNLPDNHAFVQMDYAENFTCSSADEVQCAYWNKTGVTIHPVVVYYRDNENSELTHRSYVFVSDDLGHNIGSVYAIMKQLVPQLKNDIPGLECIHYWTDSPSSQYRNKSAFYIVSDHDGIFGIPATWDYFEAGHGKGPCDGVGGTAKRMAAQSVTQEKVTIQSAPDFYKWGERYHKSATYKYVSSKDCEVARAEIDDINKTISPVKGTMQMHAIIPVKKGVIRTRVTSCYCSSCLNGNHHEDWTTAKLTKANSLDIQESTHSSSVTTTITPTVTVNEQNDAHDPPTCELNQYNDGDWVGVRYENSWHVGKIIAMDLEDGDCHVSFLRKSVVTGTGMPSLKWPASRDEIWIDFSNIICKLNDPIAIGRHGRSFQLTPAEYELLQSYCP